MAAADFDPADLDTLRALRLLAEEAARAGGRVARGYFRSDFRVRLKADRSEVSDADEAAQAAVIACIRARRSADAFLAEETLHPSADPAAPTPPTNDVLCWVIDPIDGTRNFVRGIPLYACSVAAMFGGLPLVGAIYDPERDTLYSASHLETPFVSAAPRRARPTSASRPPGLNPRLVVGLPSTPVGPIAAIAHAWLERFVCRNLGSTVLHLAMVATGELDAMLADNPRVWDLAAGCVLVTASGGKLTSPSGEPLFPLDVREYVDEQLPALAANARIHGQLVQR